jgi:hypothetical protein
MTDALAMPSARHVEMEKTVEEIVNPEMISETIANPKFPPSTGKEKPPMSGAMGGKTMTIALNPNVPNHNTADNAHNATNVMANRDTTAFLVVVVFICLAFSAGEWEGYQ